MIRTRDYFRSSCVQAPVDVWLIEVLPQLADGSRVPEALNTRSTWFYVAGLLPSTWKGVNTDSQTPFRAVTFVLIAVEETLRLLKALKKKRKKEKSAITTKPPFSCSNVWYLFFFRAEYLCWEVLDRSDLDRESENPAVKTNVVKPRSRSRQHAANTNVRTHSVTMCPLHDCLH